MKVEIDKLGKLVVGAETETEKQKLIKWAEIYSETKVVEGAAAYYMSKEEDARIENSLLILCFDFEYTGKIFKDKK